MNSFVVDAMKRVEEIKQKRQAKFIMNRYEYLCGVTAEKVITGGCQGTSGSLCSVGLPCAVLVGVGWALLAGVSGIMVCPCHGCVRRAAVPLFVSSGPRAQAASPASLGQTPCDSVLSLTVVIVVK